jgi:hypothetical protein
MHRRGGSCQLQRPDLDDGRRHGGGHVALPGQAMRLTNAIVNHAARAREEEEEEEPAHAWVIVVAAMPAAHSLAVAAGTMAAAQHRKQANTALAQHTQRSHLYSAPGTYILTGSDLTRKSHSSHHPGRLRPTPSAAAAARQHQ